MARSLIMSVTKIKSSQLLEEIMHALFPPGTIMFYASYKGDIPGFMFCDGRNLLRADYPDLYNIIGTTYGTTNFDNFNIPDLRGEFIRGWDGGRGVDASRGMGTLQTHAPGEHRHYLAANVDGTSYTLSSTNAISKQASTSHDSGYALHGSAANAEASLGLSSKNGENITTETRPRNVALAAYIKY